MILKIINLILILFFFSIGNLSFISKSHAVEGKRDWIDGVFAAFASSQRVFRGAVFYPAPAFFAAPSIILFKKLNFRGPNLLWQEGRRSDQRQWGVGIRLVNDGAPPLGFGSSFDEENDYRASRSDSIEVYAEYAYRFGFRNLFEHRFEIARATNQHESVYFNYGFRFPVYKFTSITFATGIGAKEHNQYIYGASGVGGLADQSLTLSYAMPRLVKDSIFLLALEGSWVVKEQNRNAQLILNKHNQVTFNMRWIYAPKL